MTLRQKLADWLSGGEITRLHNQIQEHRAAVTDALIARDDLRNALDELEAIREEDMVRSKASAQRYQLARVARMEAEAQNVKLRERLAMIAALETSKANATVRNMARIARGDVPVEVRS